MHRSTHPNDMEYVKAGDEQISSSGYNGLIDSAKRVQSFTRGVSNSSDIRGDKESSSIKDWVRGVVDETIPVNSIFTIRKRTDVEIADNKIDAKFTLVEPVPLFCKFTAATAHAGVFFANEDNRLFETADYYQAACDLARPFIFKYDSSDGVPKIGDPIGPKYDSFEMSLKGDDLSFTAVSAADTDLELVWCIKRCATGNTIELFEVWSDGVNDMLHPGHTVKAHILAWDPITKTYKKSVTDTKTYILFDPEEQSCLVSEDRTHALVKALYDNTGALFADAQVVGSHGTYRKVLTIGDTACGTIGDAKITIAGYVSDRPHPPPIYPTDPDCEPYTLNNNATIKSCNRLGYRRKIMDAEFTTVNWDTSRQGWEFVQEDRINLLESTLVANMCPDEDATVDRNVTLSMDWSGGFISPLIDFCDQKIGEAYGIDSIKNSKKLAGRTGDTLFARRYENRTGVDEWHVVEVEHEKHKFVKPFGSIASECPIDIPNLEIAVMTCKTEEYTPFGAWTTVIDGIGVSGCNLNLSLVRICTLGNWDGGNIQIPLTTVDVVVSLNTEEVGCQAVFERRTLCVFNDMGPAGDATIPQTEVRVITDIFQAEDECEIIKAFADVCVLKILRTGEITLPTDEVEVPTTFKEWEYIDGGTPSDPSDDICRAVFNTEKLCTFKKKDGDTPVTIDFKYTEVADGIDEPDNCTYLTKKWIPKAGCDEEPVGTPEIIFCVQDCEDSPTTVLSEANSAGSYSPTNRETQPYNYDNIGSPVDNSIIIDFPYPALEGELIAIVNNGMSNVPVLINGNGYNVQAIEAPYTLASVSVRGPKISIQYQLRLIAGINLEWRIV
jgi:hypothetical protein